MYIKLWNAHKKMYNYEEISKKKSNIVVVRRSGYYHFWSTVLRSYTITTIIYWYHYLFIFS